MLGSEKSPGIMYLTMVELYKRIEARREEKSCEVLVSYQEVRCCRAVSPSASESLSLRFGVDPDPVVPHSGYPLRCQLCPVSPREAGSPTQFGELALLVSPIWSRGIFFSLPWST